MGHNLLTSERKSWQQQQKIVTGKRQKQNLNGLAFSWSLNLSGYEIKIKTKTTANSIYSLIASENIKKNKVDHLTEWLKYVILKFRKGYKAIRTVQLLERMLGNLTPRYLVKID